MRGRGTISKHTLHALVLAGRILARQYKSDAMLIGMLPRRGVSDQPLSRPIDMGVASSSGQAVVRHWSPSASRCTRVGEHVLLEEWRVASPQTPPLLGKGGPCSPSDKVHGTLVPCCDPEVGPAIFPASCFNARVEPVRWSRPVTSGREIELPRGNQLRSMMGGRKMAVALSTRFSYVPS